MTQTRKTGNTGSKSGTGKKRTGSGRGSSTSRSTKSTGAKKKTSTTARGYRAPERVREENDVVGRDIALISLFAVMVFLFLSNFGILGPVGNVFSDMMFGLTGATAYILPIFIFGVVMFGIANEDEPTMPMKIIGAIGLFLILGIICELISGKTPQRPFYDIEAIYKGCVEGKNGGGVIAGSITYLFYHLFKIFGTILLLIVGTVICLVLLTQKSVIDFMGTQARDAKERYEIRKREEEKYLMEHPEEFEDDVEELEEEENGQYRMTDEQLREGFRKYSGKFEVPNLLVEEESAAPNTKLPENNNDQTDITADASADQNEAAINKETVRFVQSFEDVPEETSFHSETEQAAPLPLEENIPVNFSDQTLKEEDFEEMFEPEPYESEPEAEIAPEPLMTEKTDFVPEPIFTPSVNSSWDEPEDKLRFETNDFQDDQIENEEVYDRSYFTDEIQSDITDPSEDLHEIRFSIPEIPISQTAPAATRQMTSIPVDRVDEVFEALSGAIPEPISEQTAESFTSENNQIEAKSIVDDLQEQKIDQVQETPHPFTGKVLSFDEDEDFTESTVSEIETLPRKEAIPLQQAKATETVTNAEYVMSMFRQEQSQSEVQSQSVAPQLHSEVLSQSVTTKLHSEALSQSTASELQRTPSESQSEIASEDMTVVRSESLTFQDPIPTPIAVHKDGMTDGEPSTSVSEISGTSPSEEQTAVAEPSNQNTPNPINAASTQSEQPVSQTVMKAPEKVYEFPPMDLLRQSNPGSEDDTADELRETAMKLQNTLETFGVNVHITDISQGPAVTRYEMLPEQGVKVSSIIKLSDDIKLALAATDVRIEAPIPGKSAVGIEVPNKTTNLVTLRDVIDTPDFYQNKSKTIFGVGKDIAGKSVISDIAKMPHVLIAGATGSGKSVCINTIIMSILYHASPKEVKMIMIDPKVVELSVYNGIPHLMLPVVTDTQKAAATLNWAVAEMEARFRRFAESGVRDIKGYNAVVEQKKTNGEEDPAYHFMPHMVVIVDELADLMMVAKNDVETAICRLAQLARAAGIHLIIATQRPSVNVITGLIKANMPSRIAFAVTQGIDSRTILDMNGAEKLLGKGDMLFFPQGLPKPLRVQGAFVSDDEVTAVVQFLKEHNPKSDGDGNDLSKQIDNMSGDSGGSSSGISGGHGAETDVLFVEAGKFVIEKNNASVGLLQRMFRIGFNRAARIMDQLCDAGVVGESEGTKSRKILMTEAEFQEYVDTTL